MDYSLNCDFCQIVRGEQAARVVDEDDDTMSFFPLNPATAGHTLVIPKVHVQDVFGLSSHLAERLTASVLRVAHGVRQALQPAGMNLITSAGTLAQQSVPHLHVHVVPREPHDRMPDLWPADADLPVAEADRLQAQIRAAITHKRSRG